MSRNWGDLMMGGMMGGGGGGGPFGYSQGGSRRRFQEQYHCYSVAYADKAHLEVRCSSFYFLPTHTSMCVCGPCSVYAFYRS